MPETRRSITVIPEISRLAEVRCALIRLCEEWGFDRLVTLRFMLAVDEVTANVIEHGEPRSDAPIEILVGSDGENVSAEIVDRGKAFDPTSVSDSEPSSDTRKKRGFGLHLIHMIAHGIRYERTADGQNRLTFVVRSA